MVECITYLFDGDFLFGNSVLCPYYSAKATLAAYFKQLEVLLDDLPLIGQLDHLSSFVPEHPALAFELASGVDVCA